MPIINYEKWGMRVLRIGLALVFLWFGTQQLLYPNDWIGYIPTFATKFYISLKTIVFLNGILELVGGALLVLNMYVRVAAFVLAIHLVGIILSVGYNEIGVRDFGLMMATFSLSLLSKITK